MTDEPKIGLALGSGGARGFAHVGVLKVFQEENIPVHIIAGSSMGALVGALYGAGHTMDQLYKLSSAFQRKFFLDWIVPKMGFIAGRKIKDLIRLFTHGKHIEELNVQLAIIATDIKAAEKVVFTKGPIDEAVRASIAIPGIFVPEKIGGRLLVDGGVIDRVPVSVAKEMGADIVIGVDVASVKKNAEMTTIFDVIMQSIDILQLEIIESRTLASNLMIRPSVDSYNSRAFTHIPNIIAAGEQSAREHVAAIKEMISAWKEEQR
ncbi:patatin-like phospholipase family protein [Domibacillus epiphyticus]|uniref:Esterase n=1 Tax=Domibacillus epiphyticus TaxID=1714355 RepID=A0A1V2AC17_9BACI|nr:patatin-like phospholipase family protein [Domibacillus epiphyticus]OMP68507.1 esterase [Domibacillus epiphyticus]